MNVTELRKLIKAEQGLSEKTEGLWDEIFSKKVELLCENLEDTMAFLDGCTEEEFLWLSNAFEDVSERFKSSEFIECLKRNQARYPAIFEKVQVEIDYAIQVGN